MTLSLVLLARHGETEWNVAGRRQGQLDSPLTARGHSQAAKIAAMVARESIDMIAASPLGRAFETASLAGARCDLPVTVFEELVELNHGHCAGLTNAEIEDQLPGALADRAGDKYHWRFPDGESYADLDSRSARALAAIASYCPKRPLIVSHAMICRMLVRNLLELEPAEALEFEMPHGQVLEVTPAKESMRWLD